MKFKHIALIFFGIGIALVYLLVNPSEVDFLPKCPFYSTTGMYCPGCGSQRATHELLNFNIYKAFQHNVLYFVGLFIVFYQGVITGIHLLFKKKLYNYLNHPKTPLIILIFILVFWILRNLAYYPFTFLAP